MPNNLKPLISIIIPVKNGASTIDSCLNGIMQQTLFNQCEIIILDSGSTDGALDKLVQYPVKVVEIRPEEFNHGSTRNYGVSLTKGEFVVMTVQDATPSDPSWLERMFRHFNDPNVAGVCGSQIVPHDPNKNPHQWFRPQSEGGFRKVHYTNAEEFKALSPEQQKSECSWDDVTAMYRKDILKKIPFQPVMFGEDMLWAKEALLSGFTLIYDTTARVQHYHHHYPEYTYSRTLIVWLFIYKTFGYTRPKPFSISEYLKIPYRNIKWKLSIKWMLHQWSFMYNINKAAIDFKKTVQKNKVQILEEQFKLNIPQGKL